MLIAVRVGGFARSRGPEVSVSSLAASGGTLLSGVCRPAQNGGLTEMGPVCHPLGEVGGMGRGRKWVGVGFDKAIDG